MQIFIFRCHRKYGIRKNQFKRSKGFSGHAQKANYHQKRAAQKYEMLQEKLLRMEEAYASNRKLWRLLNELKRNLVVTATTPDVGVLE